MRSARWWLPERDMRGAARSGPGHPPLPEQMRLLKFPVGKSWRRRGPPVADSRWEEEDGEKNWWWDLS